MASAVCSRSAKRMPAKWSRLMRLIPGYDPAATARPGDSFDASAADDAVQFIEQGLCHIEGALAGKPFKLEDWQKAIVGCIFGWKNAAGYRRYREVFLYVPRKNGKTPLAAAIALVCLFTDGEVGAHNVCAAADTEQASLLFRHAAGMVERSEILSPKAKVYRGYGQRSIVVDSIGSNLKVVSSDASTKHGGNGHLAMIDELHAQPNRDLVDVLQTSMASANRMQPLLICITTADFDRESICNEKYDYAGKVRDGILDDPSFLPVIFEASIDDDWTDPKVWAKANPNLGVSVSEEYLTRECKRAQDSPAYENTFKRLHMNMRTQQDVRWLQLERWDKCAEPFSPAAIKGVPCWAGLDLASTTDVASFVLAFPVSDGSMYLLPYFWIPGERAQDRERRDRVPYETWGRQGFIKLTDGNVIDYDLVKRDIIELAQTYTIQEIAYDPWNATQVALQLQDDHGMTMVEFRQGFVTMNEPTKQFERLVIDGKLRHGGNPVLRWMASNVSVKTDEAGNLKPDKKKSTEKIDGIVASIMAVGRALVADGPKKSVYSSRGFRTF